MQKSGVGRSVAISTSSAGANVLVAGANGMVIKVLGFFVSVAGAVNIKFQSGVNDISGLFYGAAAGSSIIASIAPGEDTAWFQTRVGEGLNIHLSAGVAIGGVLTYKMVSGNVR